MSTTAKNQTGANTSKAADFFRKLVARFLNDANPILLKEMRVLLRTPLFVRGLFVGTAAVAILILSIGGIAAGESAVASEIGMVTFSAFVGLSFVACFFFQVAASTSITLEREGKTFESVLLTGMSSWRFVLGKFQANFVVFSLVFVSISPVLGLVFLFGGVGVSHVLLALLYVSLTLAFAVALGIFVSAQAGSTRTSVGLSLGLGGLGFWILFSVAGSMIALASFATLGGGTANNFFNEPFATVSEILFTLEGLLFLVLFPINTLGLLTSGALLLATKRLASQAEDRFVGLRLWSAVSALSILVWLGIVIVLSSGDPDFTPIAVSGCLVVGFVVSHIFVDEAPLPPAPLRAHKLPLHLRLLGPGSIPTARLVCLFLATLIAGAVLELFLGMVVFSHPADEVIPYLVYGLQGLVIIISLYTIAHAFRLTVGRGRAGALLYVAFLVASVFFPTTIASQMSDGISAMSLSPISPFVLISTATISDSLQYVGGATPVVNLLDDLRLPHVVLNVAVYGAMGLIAFASVARRVREARKEVEAREAARMAARAALDAQASTPLDRNTIQEVLRASTPPAAPESPEGNIEVPPSAIPDPGSNES